MYFYEVNLAYEGYIEAQKEKKELVRWQSYYGLSPYLKKGFKISNVWLPGDEVKEVVVAKARKVTKEEIKKMYLAAGLEPTEERLNAHIKK